MSYLSGHYDEESLELIVPVNIGKPEKSRKIYQKAQPHGLSYGALIDTGATISCISPRVIEEVRLKSAKSEIVTTAAGPASLEVYLFSLVLPLTDVVDKENGFTEETVYSYQLIEGIEFYAAKYGKHDVILGMDVISRGSLKLDPDGHFSFCL